MQLEEKEKLAEEVKQWRGTVGNRQAAKKMGISHRTFEGIIQGRGFVYPHLLRVFMKNIRPGAVHNGKTK